MLVGLRIEQLDRSLAGYDLFSVVLLGNVFYFNSVLSSPKSIKRHLIDGLRFEKRLTYSVIINN